DARRPRQAAAVQDRGRPGQPGAPGDGSRAGLQARGLARTRLYTAPFFRRPVSFVKCALRAGIRAFFRPGRALNVNDAHSTLLTRHRQVRIGVPSARDAQPFRTAGTDYAVRPNSNPHIDRFEKTYSPEWPCGTCIWSISSAE